MILRLGAFLVLVYVVGFVAFAVTLPRRPATMPADGIVVLTGGPRRIDQGAAALEAGLARRMLVSGTDRRVRPHEIAREYRIPPRLVACCIDLGHESVDTRSNGEETARWLKRNGYRSIRLVTTDWHMPRARFEIAHAAPGIVIYPDPVPSEPGLFVLVREYSKYVLRRAAALIGI